MHNCLAILNSVHFLSTQACVRTSTYITQCCNVFKTSLDGKNLEVVLAEFGHEVYGVLYEHIQHFAVSDTGALSGIKCLYIINKSVNYGR